MKKYLVLTFFMVSCMTMISVNAMEEDEIHELRHEDQLPNDKDAQMAKDAHRIGLLQGLAEKAAREAARRTFEEAEYDGKLAGLEQGAAIRIAQQMMPRKTWECAIKKGFYEGLEQGTANLVAALLIQSATLGIHKGIEWWQQPTEEELNNLKSQLKIQARIKGFESNLEKTQQIVIAYGDVIAKLGQNVEAAQKIYAAQSHSANEQSPEEKYLEMYNALSDMTLQSLQVNAMVLNDNLSALMNGLPAENEEESR